MIPNACPEPEVFAAWLAGRADPGEKERLALHVARCAACRELEVMLRPVRPTRRILVAALVLVVGFAASGALFFGRASLTEQAMQSLAEGRPLEAYGRLADYAAPKDSLPWEELVALLAPAEEIRNGGTSFRGDDSHRGVLFPAGKLSESPARFVLGSGAVPLTVDLLTQRGGTDVPRRFEFRADQGGAVAVSLELPPGSYELRILGADVEGGLQAFEIAPHAPELADLLEALADLEVSDELRLLFRIDALVRFGHLGDALGELLHDRPYPPALQAWRDELIATLCWRP